MNLFLVLLTSVLVSAADYTTYYLYPNGDMPYDNGIEPSQEYDKDGWWHNTAVPLLNLYLPQREQKGLIVSFPGGGYGALGHECDETSAGWFLQHGYAVAVVKYRLPKGHCDIPLSDACRAIELLRDSAQQWGIDGSKPLGVIGYSAGGHLAATVVTKFLTEKSRPDFGILCFPVISLENFRTHYGTRFELLGKEPTQEQLVAWSANKQVTSRTSPCFIVHCQDDDIVPVIHSVMMYEALIQQGVKAELFCPSTGKHGWNLLSEHFSQREACQQAILQFISEITLQE